MMDGGGKGKKKDVRLNLTTVLDATLILTFFLLQSAQFLDVFEIASDAPAVKTLEDAKKDPQLPLNLVLEISKHEIVVKTGLSEEIISNIRRDPASATFDMDGLQAVLQTLKLANPKENSAIFKPDPDVSYPDIVELMDAVRELNRKKAPMDLEDAHHQRIKTRKMFDQIIFDTKA